MPPSAAHSTTFLFRTRGGLSNGGSAPRTKDRANASAFDWKWPITPCEIDKHKVFDLAASAEMGPASGSSREEMGLLGGDNHGIGLVWIGSSIDAGRYSAMSLSVPGFDNRWRTPLLGDIRRKPYI